MQAIAPIASSSGIELIVRPTRDATEIDRALVAVSGDPKGGLIVSPDAFTTSNRGLIISLAARYRLPAIYAYRYFATAGGLLSYGHDISEPWRRAAAYVDKILRGASPADFANSTADKIRVDHQPKDRKSPRSDHPAAVARPRGRID